MLDPSHLAWTKLSKVASGSAPAPRCGHGFASADGMLYVFGGQGVIGEALFFFFLILTLLNGFSLQ